MVTALLSGEIQAALLPPGQVQQHIKSGKLRAVGTTSESRSILAADIPTLREGSIMGVDVELFTALAAPSSIPPAIRDKFSAAVIDVVKSPDVRQRLIAAGWQPSPSNAEGLISKVKSETRRMGGIIALRNIRVES